MFARAPRLGLVKTRLAAEIGDVAALSLYRHVGAIVIRQIREVSRVTVWFDPADARAEMESWLGEASYQPQVAGDLGERLMAAFDAHFADGPGGPVLGIGADAPGVDAGLVTTAFAALDHHPVVVGPARDGGYYLIGLRDRAPGLFRGIRWGTEHVFAETMERCRDLGVEPAVLPVLRDMDSRDDVVALGLPLP